MVDAAELKAHIQAVLLLPATWIHRWHHEARRSPLAGLFHGGSMRKPDSAGDQSLVPPRVAEAGAKVFYTYVERASLLGLLVFLFHKGEKTWTELPLGLLCVVGSVLLIAPVVAHAQLRIRGMVLRASGARLWRTFALALLLVVVLAVGAASVAIAVGEVLSKAFD